MDEDIQSDPFDELWEDHVTFDDDIDECLEDDFSEDDYE